MSDNPIKWCSIGDSITSTYSDGTERILAILNPTACAFANELILTGRWSVVNKTINKIPNKPTTTPAAREEGER